MSKSTVPKRYRQTSIQVLRSTDRQVQRLTEAGFGGFTDIVRRAIDRLFFEEIIGTRKTSEFSLLETIALNAHHLTIIEAVADHVRYYRSPAIYAALDQIQCNLEHLDGYELHGYNTSYGLIKGVLDRAEALKAKMRDGGTAHELGDDDPAFEIVRHIRNRWFGRRECDAYPNDIAERIMARYPAPYYLQ